jgi:hypothetical protein
MLGLATGDQRRAVMPTVKGIQGPYRFFFYSFDCNEPPHVHIRRDAQMCKFWLRPIAAIPATLRTPLIEVTS